MEKNERKSRISLLRGDLDRGGSWKWIIAITRPRGWNYTIKNWEKSVTSWKVKSNCSKIWTRTMQNKILPLWRELTSSQASKPIRWSGKVSNEILDRQTDRRLMMAQGILNERTTTLRKTKYYYYLAIQWNVYGQLLTLLKTTTTTATTNKLLVDNIIITSEHTQIKYIYTKKQKRIY